MIVRGKVTGNSSISPGTQSKEQSRIMSFKEWLKELEMKSWGWGDMGILPYLPNDRRSFSYKRNNAESVSSYGAQIGRMGFLQSYRACGYRK